MYSTQAEEEQEVAMAAAAAAEWWGRGRFAEVVENRSAARKGVRWRRIVVVEVFLSGALPVSLMVRLGGPLGALRWRMACCRSRSPAFALGMQCGHEYRPHETLGDGFRLVISCLAGTWPSFMVACLKGVLPGHRHHSLPRRVPVRLRERLSLAQGGSQGLPR